jgi:hypothetical protein
MRRLFIALHIVLVALILLNPWTSWCAVYYVDATGGDDGNTGLATDNAWQTISKVNGDTFSAGDSILFAKDNTWREKLTVPSSGSAGNPITFGAYGSGEKPVITGADLKTSWTSSALTGNANAITGPETIGGTGWNAPTRARMSANVATPLSPSGAQTVDGLIADTTNNTHLVDAGAGTTTPAQAYSFSVYAYPGSSNWILLQAMWFDAGWGYIDSFYSSFSIPLYGAGSLGTATGGTTGKAVYDVGGGWKRISISDTAPALAVNCLVQIIALVADDGGTFTGDNTAINTYLWGAKFENASAPSLYQNYTSYYATSTTANFIVTDDGARMLRSMDVSKGLFPNQFFWEDSTDRLYVRLTGDSNPSGSVMEAYTRQVAAEVISKSHITFDSLELTGTQATSLASSDVREYGAGLSIEVGTDNGTYQGYTVNNCTFTKNGGNGLLAWFEWVAATGGRVAQNITITNNIFNESNWELNSLNNTNLINLYGRPSDNHWQTINISGNAIYQDININPINDGGFYTGGMVLYVGGSNTSVENNSVAGSSHGITVYAYDNTTSIGTYRYNNIHDTSDDCFWIAGTFNGGTVSYNQCYNTLDQFLDTYRADAAVLQQSNLNIYNNTIDNVANACINLVKITNVNIKNNVLYQCGPSNDILQQYHAIYISDTINGSANVTIGTLVSDYNDVYISAGAMVGVFNSVESTNYTWVNWKSTKAQDAHSLDSDPLFVSTVTPDFSLQAASPAINAGVDVGLTVDYLGNGLSGAAWDIGAYEYQAAGGGGVHFPSFPSFPTFPGR